MLNVISTIAGTGVAGFSGDGNQATLAKINFPEYVCLDRCNNVYIADFMNKRVRKISYHDNCEIQVSIRQYLNYNINIYPSPTTGEVTVYGKDIEKVAVCNVVGQVVYQQDYKRADKVTVNISNLPSAIYVVRVNDAWVGKVVKE